MCFNPKWHVYVQNEKRHTLDIFVKVTDVCDEKCSDSNESTHKDDLFSFFLFFLALLFTIPLCHLQAAAYSWCDVCVKVGLAVSKSYRNARKATPETPYREMWVEVSTVCWTSSSGEACWQLWTLPV